MRYDREAQLGIGSYTVVDYTSAPREIKFQSIELLAKEFHPENHEEGVRKFTESINLARQYALCVINGNEVVGASTYKVYSLDEIYSQLYYEGRYDGDNKLIALRLASFGNLLLKNRFSLNYQYVSELAYSVVKEEHRGKGLGNFLFNARIERMKLLNNPYLIFTIARGIYAQSGITNSLRDIMLEIEKDKNGVKEGDKVNVKGEWVDAELLGSSLGCDISLVNPEAGAKQTIHLSKKSNFRPIGFSKNLSPLWCLEGRFSAQQKVL